MITIKEGKGQMRHTLMFEEIGIPGNGQATASAIVTHHFRPDRLDVPVGIVEDFDIVCIKFDGVDRLQPGSMPALLFVDVKGVRRLDRDGVLLAASVGTEISVTVRNRSKKKKMFRCSVIGDLVEGVEGNMGDVKGLADTEIENLRRQANIDDQLSGIARRVNDLGVRIDGLQASCLDRVEQPEDGRSEIMSRLSDLYGHQIDSILIAAGCTSPVEAAVREYPLGLDDTLVRAESTANITVQPQVVFRPERLVIPEDIAVDFLIRDIKVGKNSQLVSPVALPAVMFTEQAFGVRLKMDTAQISMFVTVSVTNTSKEDRYFRGVIFGPAVEDVTRARRLRRY
jgi:hypothetical protein